MNAKSALSLFVVFSLAGCVAESVQRRKPRKGPVAEVGYVDFGGGHVRYSLVGWKWFVASRRRTALRRMRANCGKDLEPRIVDEYVRQDADAPYAGDDISASMAHGAAHFHIEEHMHMNYECRPRGWTEPVVKAPPAAAQAPVLVIPPSISSAAFDAAASSPTTPSPEPPR